MRGGEQGVKAHITIPEGGNVVRKHSGRQCYRAGITPVEKNILVLDSRKSLLV